MIRRPPRSTRTDTLFPTRRSSDLPALYYLVQDPDGFLAHTLRYFTYAHHDYWQTLDEPKVMGMAGKLQIAEQMWLRGATLLAACLALYQVSVPLSPRERPDGQAAAGWPFWTKIGLIAPGAAVCLITTHALSHFLVRKSAEEGESV